MSKSNNLNDFLTGIANAIREKTGKSGEIPAQNFEDEILNISGGGTSGTFVGGVVFPLAPTKLINNRYTIYLNDNKATNSIMDILDVQDTQGFLWWNKKWKIVIKFVLSELVVNRNTSIAFFGVHGFASSHGGTEAPRIIYNPSVRSIVVSLATETAYTSGTFDVNLEVPISNNLNTFEDVNTIPSKWNSIVVEYNPDIHELSCVVYDDETVIGEQSMHIDNPQIASGLMCCIGNWNSNYNYIANLTYFDLMNTYIKVDNKIVWGSKTL